MKRFVFIVAVAAAALLIPAAVFAHGQTEKSSAQTSSSSKQGPYTIGFSNSYIGNGWRIEMENIAETFVKRAPYDHLVKMKVVNSGNNVSAQIQAFDNMISSGVDAIVTDAASPTGLNAVIAKAHQAGIPVISFDSLVSSPYAYKVSINQFDFGVSGATWLAKTMGYKGNVILNRGVKGTQVDIDRTKGAMSVFNKYPNIHVIAQIYGKWDAAVTEQRFAAALASYPKIDGIWGQGGGYGIIQAFEKAGRKLPPIACEAQNGFRLAMANKKLLAEGFRGYSIGDPPSLSASAIKVAVEVLQGKKLPLTIYTPAPVVTEKTVKIGFNAFPNLPMNTYDDWNIPGFRFTPAEVLGKSS